MPFTVTMPKLSPTMEEGTIAKWHVKEGDKVESGALLLEVATDKATVEHNALDEGYLRKILISEGGEARVNQPIAIFTETAEESIDGYQPEGEMPSKEAPASVEEKETPVAAAEAPVAAPTSRGGGMQQPAFVPEPPLEGYFFEEAPTPFQGRVLASPLARKLAEEKRIDLSTIKGTGPHGRIVSRDLETGQPTGIVSFGKTSLPSTPPGTYQEELLSPMRKAIGRRLQESKTFIPHFYVTQEIDAEPMARLREELKAGGVKVTYNDLIVRATALTLRQHPEMNSGFHTVNNSIIRFQTIDISIAVSLPDGLITPIIRHADYKSLGEIGMEVKSLAKRAKEGKLAREEYMGGSFTLSNLGMYGVRDFIAVINPPQAAILAIGGLQEKPVIKNGQIVPGKTMAFTLSADHRVVDGVDSAKFLATFQNLIEHPALLLV